MSTKPRFTIDVDEWQRGLCTAMIVGVTVVVLYNVMSFTVTTVKNGVVTSGTMLAARAQRAMESLMAPIEDLFMNADELGAASLFERFPYPHQVTLERKPAGTGTWLVKNVVIHGANLDVLRSVEVDYEGVSGTESGRVEKPPDREGERFDFQPTALKTINANPTRAVLTLTAIGGSRYRYGVPVKLEDEREDEFESKKKKKVPPVPTTVASVSTPAGTTTGPGGTSGGGETAVTSPTGATQPSGPADEGQADLVAIIKDLSTLTEKQKKHYEDRLGMGQFDEGAARNILFDMHRSKADPATIDQHFVRVLDARYMRERRAYGAPAPVHTATAREVQQAIAWRGRAAFLKEIDNVGTLAYGIRAILGQVLTAPQIPTTPASAQPTATGSVAPQADTPSGRYEEAHFHAIWAQEQSWKDCMSIVDLIQKAYDVANQDSVTPGELNIPLLVSRAHLEYVPSCSEPTAGGQFVLDAGSRRVRCSRHGTRALPWAERRAYELHFNELERARILVRQQGRVKEAIGTLKSYLSRHYGREENNLYAQGYLGRLYFQERNYEAAMPLLKTLADRYPKSVRFAYETALCFYARTNEHFALEYVNQALRALPSEFDKTMDEESTAYDLYLLRDQAKWMHKNLAPVQIGANGERRELAPLRYADFALKQAPEMDSKVCYEGLGQVRALLPKVVAAVRARAEFKARMTRYDNTKASLAALPEYEKQQRMKAREALSYARRQLRELSMEALKAAKIIGMPEIRPCPGKGSYHVEAKPRLNVECTMHPGLRPVERIDVNPALDAQDVRTVDLVLQHALIANSPALSACVERQRKILDAFRTDDLEVKIEKDAQLSELAREAKVTQADLRPSATELYALEPEGEAAVLECTVHFSLQRMTLRQDGIDLLDPTKP